ncbi:MAG: DevR family CRISPR-associated autoregulator [Chloroflexi bacterium]|nr:DevR family CRISPR-associated autoregulator [Chloroflexota bacterium]
MSNPIYSLSISARALLNLHSLNNEGGEGNQIQTRMVDIVHYDAEGKPVQANVNAISGDMFKHILVEHLHRIAQGKGLPLCSACQKLDANRMSAAPEFREWLKSKPTQVQVLDKLVHDCTIDDLAGNLITEGSLSVPRKSTAEFGWVVGIPNAVTTDEYFHVKYVPDRREKPTDEDERKGNLGQAIFHRPASSGVYAIVCNFEAARIGYNDITQTYLNDVNRQARLAALLESALYTFVEMNGAMRNTQMPHLVELHGVITVSRGVVPAPTVSPINENFVQSILDTRDALNVLHDNGAVEVHEFANLGEFARIMAELISEAQPYTLRVG